MKFTDFSKLKIEIRALGADPVAANLEKELTGRGISVEADSEKIVVGSHGIYLVEHGKVVRVVIHIVDKNLNSSYARETLALVDAGDYESLELIESIHKYHVLKCKTIENAENQGWRKDRYKMARSNDGAFYYRFLRDNNVYKEREHQKLRICKNCLKVVNSVMNTSDSVETFSIKDFLTSVEQFDIGLPKQGDYADVCSPNIYPDDWHQISLKYRQQINYKCENSECRYSDLSAASYRKYLHTHHKSHDVTNNHYSNLEALCIYCHAQQAGHGQLRNLQDYKEYCDLRGLDK